ncbi:MAG: hypothetical protein AAGC71_10600 [Pseudomonadota bacterium]
MLNQHKHSSRTGIVDIVVAIFIATALAGFAASARASDAATWVAIDAPGIDQAWLSAETAPATYTHYRIEPIGFWHLADPETTDTQLIASVRETLQQRFSSDFELRGLQPADASNDAAATTLVLRLQLIDLVLHAPDHYDALLAERYRFDLAPGHMTLVGELASGNGTTLLRTADMQPGGDVRGWSGVTELLSGFQGRFGAALVSVGLPGSLGASLAAR